MISVLFQYLIVIIKVNISLSRGYSGRLFSYQLYPKTINMLKNNGYIVKENDFVETVVEINMDKKYHNYELD